jgi:hypothetical protein
VVFSACHADGYGDVGFRTIVQTDDRRDVTVLVVGTDNANIVRNLQGEPSFQSPVRACLPFGGLSPDPNSLDSQFLITVKAQIESKGGAQVGMTACDARQLGQYDLVIFTADQIANGTPDVLARVVEILRSRQFVPLSTYTIAAFAAEEKARFAAQEAEEARKRLAREAARQSLVTRDPELISALYIAAPAPIVCSIATIDTEGLQYFLKKPDSVFADFVDRNSKFRTLPSIDAIFIALKKHECAAAVAPAGQLRDVLAALLRDKIAVEVHATTIDRGQLADWKRLSAEESASAQAEQARRVAEERRRQAELAADEQQKRILAEQRRKLDEESRRDRLVRMRQLVESKATAVVQDFVFRLKKDMDGIRLEVEDARQRAASGQVLSKAQELALQSKNANATIRNAFPGWASEFSNRVKEGWEFGDIRPATEDYGRAQWRGRPIEAIVVRVEFPMVNRVIGERQTACLDFLWINDEEFSFMRQPRVVSCERFAVDFTDWALANAFVTQWKLLQD